MTNTSGPSGNKKVATLPASTIASVSEIIDGLKSSTTPFDQREYLLQKGTN